MENSDDEIDDIDTGIICQNRISAEEFTDMYDEVSDDNSFQNDLNEILQKNDEYSMKCFEEREKKKGIHITSNNSHHEFMNAPTYIQRIINKDSENNLLYLETKQKVQKLKTEQNIEKEKFILSLEDANKAGQHLIECQESVFVEMANGTYAPLSNEDGNLDTF